MSSKVNAHIIKYKGIKITIPWKEYRMLVEISNQENIEISPLISSIIIKYYNTITQTIKYKNNV